MARMVPNLDTAALDRISSKAEKTVYLALREQLPHNHLVVHSLELLGNRPGVGPRDSEADFVVFDPDAGYLVLEVKGGGIEVDPGTGKWSSRDRHGVWHDIKDPFRQARNAKHELLRTLKNASGWGHAGMPHITIGHAVLFPDLADTHRLVGPDRPGNIMGGRNELEDAAVWIQCVMSFWVSKSEMSNSLGELGMRVVESTFCKKVRVDVPLSFVLKDESSRQIDLTKQQGRILASLGYRSRAAIAGGAGTGKTLLAMQHAKKLASQGRRTLLVCFNRALADFLKHEAQDIEDLDCMSFHQLCYWRSKTVRAEQGIDLLKQAENTMPTAPIYDVQYPFALAQSTEYSPFRYAAIVVDEAQDFGEEFWLPLELLLEDPDDSPLFLFFDPNQAVYKRAESFPILDPPFLLTTNCRNTDHIHRVAYQFYHGDEVFPPGIDGAPHRVLTSNSIDAQAKQIQTQVSELISRESVSPSDICILILDKDKRHYYQALKNIGRPAQSNWSFEKHWVPQTVLVDTARRFKGLESMIVFLWGFENILPDRDRELLYVGLSRARSRLFLVCAKQHTAFLDEME